MVGGQSGGEGQERGSVEIAGIETGIDELGQSHDQKRQPHGGTGACQDRDIASDHDAFRARGVVSCLELRPESQDRHALAAVREDTQKDGQADGEAVAAVLRRVDASGKQDQEQVAEDDRRQLDNARRTAMGNEVAQQ